MNLTPNFTLSELTHSDTAIATGLNNTPDPQSIANLTSLTQHILQPLRDRLGKPIHITSGYRSPAVNTAVGGAQNSQHTKGEAVDIQVDDMPPEQILVYVKALQLPFDQCIIEKANGKQWLHMSYSNKNRKQVLKYDGKTYTDFG
jgi:hypothetical protein